MLIDNLLKQNPKVLLRDNKGRIEGIILEGEYKGKFYNKNYNGEITEASHVSKELLDIYNKNYKDA